MVLDMPMDSAAAPELEGVLVARHGKLVLEEYFHGEYRDKLHDTRSATKSLTATVVGAAMQAGVPLKLSSPVYETMGAATDDPRKKAMTLEHLLMMRSGFYCDDSNPEAPGNENTMLDQEKEPDYYRYTLAVPMADDPDKVSVYCSANPNLALGMVGAATHEFANAHFRPSARRAARYSSLWLGVWTRPVIPMAAAACSFCRATS